MAELSMRRNIASIAAVVLVSFVVRLAVVKLEDSGKRALLAGPGVRGMTDCKSCRDEREGQGNAPRHLVTLPSEIFNNPKVFKKKTDWSVCEYCDGGLLATALAESQKRTQTT